MYTNTKHFISRRSFWNTLGLQILSLLVKKIFWARRILRSIAIIITINIITIIIIIIIIRFPRQHLWSSLYFLLQLLSSSTASYTGIFVYNIYLYLYLPHIKVFCLCLYLYLHHFIILNSTAVSIFLVTSVELSIQPMYEKVSDVAESRVWFTSKNLTPCRMHWNALLKAQIIAKCHSFPNMFDML